MSSLFRGQRSLVDLKISLSCWHPPQVWGIDICPVSYRRDPIELRSIRSLASLILSDWILTIYLHFTNLVMSAPRQSSPLAAGLEIPCPILESLSDTSEVISQPAAPVKIAVFREEFPEPEDNPCQPCSETSRTDIKEDSVHPCSDGSEVISAYVAKMREGIKKQGERLRQEEVRENSVEGSISNKENEQVDFHIKVVPKKKPAPLLLNAKMKRDELLSSIKSTAHKVSFLLPKKTRSPKASEGIASIRSQSKRILVVFPESPSTPHKLDGQRPKIKSRYARPATPAPVNRYVDKKQSKAAMSDRESEDEEIEEGEDIALLSANSSASSPRHSSEASHFYTPTMPSQSQHQHEYRQKKAQFRKSVDLSRKAVSRSLSSLSSRLRSIVSLQRKRGGWSRLD